MVSFSTRDDPLAIGEVLLHIFSFLDDRDLQNAACVCERWRRLALEAGKLSVRRFFKQEVDTIQQLCILAVPGSAAPTLRVPRLKMEECETLVESGEMVIDGFRALPRHLEEIPLDVFQKMKRLKEYRGLHPESKGAIRFVTAHKRLKILPNLPPTQQWANLQSIVDEFIALEKWDIAFDTVEAIVDTRLRKQMSRRITAALNRSWSRF